MKTTQILFSTILLALCTFTGARGQQFDKWFADSTLRLDYIFAGNADTEHIFFEQAYSSPRWAGRKARLAETFLRGNGKIELRDHETKELLFTHSFSTLFQEWKAEEEARHVDKAFETSYNVPFPRKPVDVTVTLFDFHGKASSTMTHVIDPTDILIRPLGNTGIPYYYIWKGTPNSPNHQTTKQPNHQTTKQPNHQTTKQPNNQTTKPPTGTSPPRRPTPMLTWTSRAA